MSRTLVLPLAVVLSCVLSFACGEDGGGGGSDEPVVVSEQIAAATGGTVRDPGGKAELVIPGGALAADTEITLAISGKADGSATKVYDFGPDGLTFTTPAALSIALEGSVPAGKRAVLAIGSGSGWYEITGSTVEGGRVVGPVAHFSRFTVIFVDDGAVANACEDELDAFDPCGGDPIGVWSFTEICAQNVPVEDPFDGACPQLELSAEVVQHGTLTITADMVHVTRFERHITETGVFPSSCLESGQSCTSINGNSEGYVCSGSATCTCTRSYIEDNEDSSDPYTNQGSSLLVDGTTVPFCVEGDAMELIIAEDGFDVLYQLARTPEDLEPA